MNTSKRPRYSWLSSAIKEYVDSFNVTGEIRKVPSITFDWEIHDFLSLSSEVGKSYCSPHFEIADGTWCLQMFPNGGSVEYLGYISLYLKMVHSRYLKHAVKYKVSLKDKDEEKFINRKSVKHEFTRNGHSFGWSMYLKRSELLEKLPEGPLIVSCTFSWYCSVPGNKKQTTALRVPETIPRGPEEITPGDEERSKHGTKDKQGITIGTEKVLQNFRSLLLSKEDSDVILKVQNQEFKAHMCILKAQSPVFCSMLKHDMVEKRTGVVDILDCNPDIFQDFLLYLYSGKVEKMVANSVVDLYIVADKYDIDDLKKECTEFMIKNLSVETICDFVALALRHSESMLLKFGREFFTKNIKKITVTDKWQTFIGENPVPANELIVQALDTIVPE